MEYKKLSEVNKNFKPIDISGKMYIGVPQRVDGFHCLYPNGRIVTDIISITDNTVIMKASIYDGDILLATGHGMEFRDDKTSFVNRWAFLENCETSAVGRALGMLGINGQGGEIATSEEVKGKMEHQFAEANQKPVPDYVKKTEQKSEEIPPSDARYQRLLADANAIGVDMNGLIEYCKHTHQYEHEQIPYDILRRSIEKKKASIAAETVMTTMEATDVTSSVLPR